MSVKNPLTLAGIEPATVRSVAQHLNHCATACPIYNSPPAHQLSSNLRQGLTSDLFLKRRMFTLLYWQLIRSVCRRQRDAVAHTRRATCKQFSKHNVANTMRPITLLRFPWNQGTCIADDTHRTYTKGTTTFKHVSLCQVVTARFT